MKHTDISYDQLYSNKLCVIIVGDSKLYILNDFWGFGLGDSYWKTSEEERTKYNNQIKENPEEFFNNYIFAKSDTLYVTSIYNNRLLGSIPEDSEEAKRYQQEDIEMIAPVISLWIDKQLSKLTKHQKLLSTQLFWKYGRTLTEKDKVKIAEVLKR